MSGASTPPSSWPPAPRSAAWPTSIASPKPRPSPRSPSAWTSDQATVTELAEYYRERAAEYDAVYAKPERQQDLARLHGLLPPLVAGQRVLEIAAGTGYWTRVLSGSAASITATDLNAETLELARAREYGGAAGDLPAAGPISLWQRAPVAR